MSQGQSPGHGRSGLSDGRAEPQLDRRGAAHDLGGLAGVQQRRAHDQLRARVVVEHRRHRRDRAAERVAGGVAADLAVRRRASATAPSRTARGCRAAARSARWISAVPFDCRPTAMPEPERQRAVVADERDVGRAADAHDAAARRPPRARRRGAPRARRRAPRPLIVSDERAAERRARPRSRPRPAASPRQRRPELATAARAAAAAPSRRASIAYGSRRSRSQRSPSRR